MKLEEKVKLDKYNTYGVGGRADYFLKAQKKEDLVEAISFVREKNIPYIVLGKGSNILFSDSDYSGLVILNELKGIEREGDKINVLSGATLAEVVKFSKEEGLSGAEFLAGIPGTLGGAILGNAGAFGRSLGEIVESVDFLTEGGIERIEKNSLEFGYRDSGFKRTRGVIVSALISLHESTKGAVEEKVREILDQRKDKHPKGRTCGSFFKNIEAASLPPEVQEKLKNYENHDKIPAGKLIEAAGLKGMRVGDVEVSQVHANFLVNTGHATSSDIGMLAKTIEVKVLEIFGVNLEPEVRIVDSE